MKRIVSLFLVFALMAAGCLGGFSVFASADAIPANALRVYHVNKVVASNQISVFTDYQNFVNCNVNGWGVYYQLRATDNANEYSVVAKSSNPADGGFDFSELGFVDQSGDIYMQVNGGSVNALVYNLSEGTAVTFINLTLATGDYSDTYVYAGKPIMASGELINNKITKTNLLNSVGVIQTVASSSAASLLASDNAPANAHFDATGANLTTLLGACIENNVLPTVEIETSAEATALITAMNTYGCYDVNVISADASLLKQVRDITNVARTGLIYDLGGSALTSKEASAVRDMVRSAPATFVVIDSEYASYQSVYELRELGIAVWARASAKSTEAAFAAEVVNTLTAGVNGIITDNASKVIELINGNFVKNTMTRTPYIVGHRGNPDLVTENTLESFISAYENGADIFELDVYATTDGKLAIFHDYSLGTAEGLKLTTFTGTTAEGAIQNMTSAQVKQYKYKTGEEIAFLDQVFDYFKGKDVRIFVEFKGSAENTVKYTAQLIEEYDISDQIVVITSAGYFMEWANKYFENKMSLGYIYYPQLITNNSDWATTDNMEECLEILATTLNTLQAWNGNLSPLCNAVANGYLGAAVANRGLVLNPWGYAGNTNNNIGFFSDIDSITTDDNQYFKNMAKYVTAEDVSLMVRQAFDGTGFEYTTYGRVTDTVNIDNAVYSVISGDSVKVIDGKLYAVAEGDSQVVMGYKTKTTSGRAYVLYSQVVTVSVNGIDETLPDPEAAPDPEIKGLRGDVNENSEIDARDYVLLKRAYFGTASLNETATLLADVNNSGGIDARDYVMLKRAYFKTYEIPEEIKYVY